MGFLFGKSLSPERFEELNKCVLCQEELSYQICAGNSIRSYEQVTKSRRCDTTVRQLASV